MQEEKLRKSPKLKRSRRRAYPYPTDFLRFDDSDFKMYYDAEETQDVQANSKCISQSIIYYALLLVKVALWVLFAWILSHIHLGAPCFLLPLILWLYFVPMHRALRWTKRRLLGKAA